MVVVLRNIVMQVVYYTTGNHGNDTDASYQFNGWYTNLTIKLTTKFQVEDDLIKASLFLSISACQRIQTAI